MRNDRRTIFSLVALGRITPSEVERLLIFCNAGRDGFWIFAACVAATLFTHVSRVSPANDSLHHALSFMHQLSGGVQ
jgi:hypothetical protein